MSRTPALISCAAERNKQPIADVLREWLPDRGSALEIASGSGQHVAWFAQTMPGWTWQPSDHDAQAMPAISATLATTALRAPCLRRVRGLSARAGTAHRARAR